MKITELKQNTLNLVKPPFTTRKIVYVCVALLIIIFLFIVFLAAITKPNTVPQQISVNHPAISPTTAPLNPFPEGGRYQGTSYSIAYPKGSQKSLFTFPEGDTFLAMPPDYPGEPTLDAEEYNTSQNLNKKDVLYLAEGAKKSTLVINGNSLTELSNTYKSRVINGEPIHTPTQFHIAYLIKPNAFYVFRIYYSSSVPIQVDENLFMQFLQSFAINTK